MTITSEVGRAAYAGDGASTQFTVPFKFFQSSDLRVILQSANGVDSELTENVDYTVSGAGDEGGGTVTLAKAPASGQTLTIILDPPRTQLTDYVSNDAFPAESHERALDRLTQQNIRALDIVSRALRLPDGDPNTLATLPGAAARANKFLRFDNNGNPEMAVGIDQSQTLSQSVIGQFLYPQTPAEVAAGVTPTNYAYRPLNVHRYGALGDGVTDDTAALNRAISVANVGGGLLELEPHKTYLISSRLNFTAHYTGIIGAGWSSVIKIAPAAGTRFIPILVQNLTGSVKGCVFANFAIDGSGKGQLDAGLLQLNNAVGFLVDHVYVYDGGTPGEAGSSGVNGITMSAGDFGATGSVGWIRNCLVERTTKAGFNVSTESVNVVIENCIARYCAGNGQTPGFQVLGAYNAKLIGCTAYRNEGVGFVLGTTGTDAATYRFAKYGIVANCHAYENGQGTTEGHGFKVGNVAGQVSDVTGRIIFANCMAWSNGVGTTAAAGWDISNFDDVYLNGCIAERNQASGIVFANVRRAQVSGGACHDNNESNTSTGSGVYVFATGESVTEYLSVQGVSFLNSSGKHQKYPIWFDAANPAGSVREFQFIDNLASGHEVRNFPLSVLPKKAQVRHVFDYQTTDATNKNAGFFTLEDDSAYLVHLVAVAKKSDGSARGFWDRTALVYRDGAGATIQGTTQDTTSGQESDPGLDGTIVVSGNDCGLQVTGLASSTIDWRIEVEILSI